MKKQLYLIGILISAAGIYYFMTRPSVLQEKALKTLQPFEQKDDAKQEPTPKEDKLTDIMREGSSQTDMSSLENMVEEITANNPVIVYAYATTDTVCSTPRPVTPTKLDTRYEYPEINAIVTLLNGNLPQGYQHIFASGTTLQQLSISQGTATIDLNNQLTAGEGSCTQNARAKLITQTLLQFPDIKTVIITVNGVAL